MRQSSNGGSVSPTEGPLARLEERLALLAGEREAARELLAELLVLPAAQRELAARGRAACHTLALAELLVERSAEEGPDRGLELARLAVAVADRLEPARYGTSLVHDLRGRAWAQLAEARRWGGDLRGAAEALAVAEQLCENGSADPLEEGYLLERRAALLADQGDAEGAAVLLSLAAEIYESVADVPRSRRARTAASGLGARLAAERVAG